ncbi:MAG TPA: hypothetical protein PK264_08280 [Hyphomicrobiaceae bacterium]|nr:hypothetical protein [Hyphomicrobiaceae bacterium]
MEREVLRLVGAGLVVLVDCVGNAEPNDLASVEDYATILISRAVEADTPGLSQVTLAAVEKIWAAIRLLGVPAGDVDRYLRAVPTILDAHRPCVASCQGAFKALRLGQIGDKVETAPSFLLASEVVSSAKRADTLARLKVDGGITLALLERLFAILLPERLLIAALVPLLRPASWMNADRDNFIGEEGVELEGMYAR